jgi:hypothetical protein
MDKPSNQLWVLEVSKKWKIDPKISTAIRIEFIGGVLSYRPVNVHGGIAINHHPPFERSVAPSQGRNDQEALEDVARPFQHAMRGLRMYGARRGVKTLHLSLLTNGVVIRPDRYL